MSFLPIAGTSRVSGPVSSPVRTCIGCRRRTEQSQLVRVVAATPTSSGQVEITPDPRGRLPGRGAWLHPAIACFEQAVRRRAFGRALRLTGAFGLGELESYLTDRAEHDRCSARTEQAEQTVGGPDQDRPNS